MNPEMPHMLWVPDSDDPTHDNGRKNALWGTLMAGGAGNEWYFGYKHANSDLSCNDFRSRDLWWDQCRIALNFFTDYTPFWDMKNRNNLTTGDYCFAKPGDTYVVFLKNGGNKTLTLESGVYDISWFNPRTGDTLIQSEPSRIAGPGTKNMGYPPSETSKDWVALVRKNETGATGSDDAKLIGLTTDAGILVPAFSPQITAYTLNIPYGSSEVNITTNPSNGNAFVSGAGPMDVTGGSTTASVLVTSQDSSRTRTYTIEIKVNAPSDDATLSGLITGTGVLVPLFSPSHTNYSLTVPVETSSVNITAQRNDANASVSGDGNIDVSSGSTTADITVTAEDGTSTLTYTILITVLPDAVNSPGTAGVAVYPNPASTKIMLKGIPDKTSVNVINSMGQVVAQTLTRIDFTEIDVSSLNKGMYLLKAEKRGKTFLSRLIILQ